MKSIAEKVADLKVREEVAWKRYTQAIEKECNALLRRFGTLSGDEARLVGISFNALADEHMKATKEENAVKSISCYSDYALVYAVVRRMDYISNLFEKWIKVSNELFKIEQAIKGK